MSPSPKRLPTGSVTTRRWNDPPRPGEGTRILVCLYRPRGVRREDEPWDEWVKELGPSTELHAAAYGKGQPAIDFDAYRARYLAEMQEQPARLYVQALRGRVAGGESIALLCSSACLDEARCHRSLLRELVLG
jgi:uncharacterized protein YeaO (DUF488 family)